MNTSPNGKPDWIETMQDRTLQTRPFDVCISAASRDLASTGEEHQTLRGFGGCFNEIGWLPLQKPGREDQDRIVRELSSPDELNPVFTRNPDGTIVSEDILLLRNTSMVTIPSKTMFLSS